MSDHIANYAEASQTTSDWMKNYYNFAREFVRNPREIGAVCPSSRFLARRMANLVPPGDGLVIELGPGEGAVTAELLDRGIPPGQLVLVERSEILVEHLNKRFPGVQVICGDASDLSRLIPQGKHVRAIVSGLPLRSLPKPVVQQVLGQISLVSGPGTAYIQFTYAVAGGYRGTAPGYELDRMEVVWRNLPPARIEVFRVRSSQPSRWLQASHFRAMPMAADIGRVAQAFIAGAAPDGAKNKPAAHQFRTLWLSDMHLGTRDCKAEALLDLLRNCHADSIYLVGDIIDGWQLHKGGYWPQAHNAVVQELMGKAAQGSRVVFIPGNHDEFARNFHGQTVRGIEVQPDAVHVTADGTRLWIVHGDGFDGVVMHAKWLAYLGDALYTFTLKLNRWFNQARHLLGLSYWSLSQYLKGQVKNAVSYISNFEQLLAKEAAQRQCDGVVCGHIHHAELRQIDGSIYANCGDWVESLTALSELRDGTLQLMSWNPIASEPVILAALQPGSTTTEADAMPHPVSHAPCAS